MLWCERRKPFQESMLNSKTAIFKLRKELRCVHSKYVCTRAILCATTQSLYTANMCVHVQFFARKELSCVQVNMCVHVQFFAQQLSRHVQRVLAHPRKVPFSNCTKIAFKYTCIAQTAMF